jgi:hypothetical protein
MSQIPLDLPPNSSFSIDPPEHEEDRVHRHKLETRNQVKDFFLIGCGVLFTFLVLGFAIKFTFDQPTPELQKNGLALIGSILTGVLGFLAGWATTKRSNK